MKYQCEDCGYEFAKKIKGLSWYSILWRKCPKCKGKAGQKGIKDSNFNLSYKKYREATAFGIDKKSGAQVALDKKGRKFDPRQTRYNLEKDPHGWRAIKGARKVRKTDKYGRPNYI